MVFLKDILSLIKINSTEQLSFAYYLHLYCNIDSTSEFQQILNLPFPSLKEAYQWLVSVTQKNFLREEFKLEGIGQEKEKLNVNTKQWLHTKLDLAEVEKNKESKEFQLLKSARALNLIAGIPWPLDKPVDCVVVLGSMDEIVKERVAFLQNFKGSLFYTTGPRGLFNFESSLAAILASQHWFDMPEKKELIQKILNEHQSSCDPLQWTRNLSALKQKLVSVLEAKSWPAAKNSYYYSHKELYDLASDEACRERLDCEGGAWPVAMDMFAYYVQQRINAEPSLFNEVKLIPVVARPKNGRLVTIDDTVETWFKEYGKEFLLRGCSPLFITCNHTHSIPFVTRNIHNKMYFHSELSKLHLAEKLTQFIHDTKQIDLEKSKFDISKTLRVAGPAAKKLHMQQAKDGIAKLVYTLITSIDKIIKENASKEEKELPSAKLIKQIIFYHNELDYFLLANSIIDLALMYHFNNKFIKSGGLINFAINVLRNLDEEVGVVSFLQDAALKNLIACIVYECKKTNSTLELDVQIIRQHYLENKKNLMDSRRNLYEEFKKMSLEDNKDLISFYKLCFKQMRQFFSSVVRHATLLLGRNEFEFALGYLGSYSRQQATPFSDVEYFMLLKEENNDTLQLSISLTKLILLQVVNLGETILPALGIVATDFAGKKVNLVDTIFDRFTPKGFSLDGKLPQACKTPLGRKGGVAYRLIGTPSGLVERFASLNGYQLDPLFPQIFSTTQFLFGNRDLYAEFQLRIMNNNNYHKQHYSLALLKRDLYKFQPLLKQLNRKYEANHDKYYFKPINVLIDDLVSPFTLKRTGNSFYKIRYLVDNKIIPSPYALSIMQTLNATLYLRMSQHFTFNQHRIDINSDNTNLFPILIRVGKNLLFLYDQLNQTLLKKESIALLKEDDIARTNLACFFKPSKFIKKNPAQETAIVKAKL